MPFWGMFFRGIIDPPLPIPSLSLPLSLSPSSLPFSPPTIPPLTPPKSETLSPSTPISAGFYRLAPGPPLVYDYTYDEMKILLEGQMDITDEGTGKTVRAGKGDVFFFPKGVRIRFEVPEGTGGGLAWFCGQRGSEFSFSFFGGEGRWGEGERTLLTVYRGWGVECGVYAWDCVPLTDGRCIDVGGAGGEAWRCRIGMADLEGLGLAGEAIMVAAGFSVCLFSLSLIWEGRTVGMKIYLLLIWEMDGWADGYWIEVVDDMIGDIRLSYIYSQPPLSNVCVLATCQKDASSPPRNTFYSTFIRSFPNKQEKEKNISISPEELCCC